MEEHCKETSKALGQEIICTSVVDLSLEEKSSNELLSLEKCLEVVQQRYPGKKIDVVIDEMDSEDLQRDQVNRLRAILKDKVFATSEILIALQPCEKKREVMHNGKKIPKLTREHCYKELEGVFEICKMVSTMRFTSNIGQAVGNMLGKVEQKPNVYPCGHDTSDSDDVAADVINSNQSSSNNNAVISKGLPSLQGEQPHNSKSVKQTHPGYVVDNDVDYGDDDYENRVVASNHNPREDDVFVQPERMMKENLDDQQSLKFQEEERDHVCYNTKEGVEDQINNTMESSTLKVDALFRHQKHDKSPTSLHAHFKHIKSERSGVNITGDKPRLLRLKKNNDVRPLAYFLNAYMKKQKPGEGEQPKMMLICSTVEMIKLARAALKTIKVTFVEYTDNICGLPARSTAEKRKIVEEWRKEKQVLLVDCRGCKGMECEEVKTEFLNQIYQYSNSNCLWQDHRYICFLGKSDE